MTLQPDSDLDFTVFDHETLLLLEKIAAENLQFYHGFQEQLERMEPTESVKSLIPLNADNARECGSRLEMIRKALSAHH